MSRRRSSASSGQMPPAEPGDVVIAPISGTGGATRTWVVPDGVTEICLVMVQRNGASAHVRLQRGSTVLLATNSTIGGNIGGGEGGAAGYTFSGGGQGGGGGAGGYAGNGGRGGHGFQPPGSGIGGNGVSGQGGGGGGGQGGGNVAGSSPGNGGPVGLQGQGANGSGASGSGNGSPGGTGSPATGLLVGAGAAGQAGGALRWLNFLPVTPGETLTFYFALASAPSGGFGEAARVLWGGGRSFPSNASDALPSGQITITGQNIGWTVPAGVTLIHCAAQQRGQAVNIGNDAVSVAVSGVTVVRAQNGNRLGDGGGDGGAGNNQGAGSNGGGGAGGYAGDGGKGGGTSDRNQYNEFFGYQGAAGAGAGAGNGGGGETYQRDGGPVFGGTQPYVDYPATPGVGVGIAGRTAAGSYSDPIDGDLGGGSPGFPSYPGGALAWKNSIAVTPGQVITVTAANGRVRIIWGPGRSYPNNAGKV